MFKPQEISATEARKYFSQIINKVQFSSKSFTVKTYRRPAVRFVKEEYIAALEQVLGRKTVNQILEISGGEDLSEFAKVEEIKKIFQRRLSGGPRPQTQSSVAAGHASPKPAPVAADSQSAQLTTKPSTERCSYKPTTATATAKAKANPPKPNPPVSSLKHQASENRRVLLLQNGKNYK